MVMMVEFYIMCILPQLKKKSGEKTLLALHIGSGFFGGCVNFTWIWFDYSRVTAEAWTQVSI